jgi:hypothetical protein
VTDVERVRAALSGGQLLHPNDGVANTVDLARAMASLAGAPSPMLDARAQLVADAVGTYEHYVFVLIDGLGMNLIDRLSADAFFRRHVALDLRAVFPSSTAPALTSIATARWPAEHAVPGWWTYLPDCDLTATILPYVERFSETPLDRATVRPDYAFPVAARAREFGHAFTMFAPEAIAGSTYSRYSSGDAPHVAYKTLGDAVDSVARRVTSASAPTYSYLYYPEVDVAEHIHGPFATEPARILEHAQNEVARLADLVSDHARVIVTADHGQFAVENVTVVTREDPLVSMLRIPPTGDGRAVLFHVCDGMHDDFANAFRQRFSEGAALLSTEEAQSMGLFGPVPLSDEARRRVGDFVSVAFNRGVLLYEPKGDDRLLGHHGGLTPDEMRVPLILV